MDYKTITERYTYDDGVLYYKEDISSRARRGQKVGSMSGTGYKQIKYNDMMFQYHRIIYCYFNECGYDDISGWDIDHLDNNKSNNRIENLILCEHWENQLNRVDTKRNGGLYDESKRRRERYKTDKEYRERTKAHQRRYYVAKGRKDR